MSIVEKAMEKLRDAGRPGETRAVAAESGFATRVAEMHRATHAAKSGAGATATGSRITIDRNSLRSAGVLPPPQQERAIADQYRQIKRPLIANAMGTAGTRLANGHIIMLASAVPGEGKTFTAINLAFSMAREKDVSVLLVDADTPKPQISDLFGAGESAGLLDALQDETIDVESLIRPTDIPGLSLLPAGRRNEIATELLASARMRVLATELGERDPRRIVLVDSPPLLLTTESQALAAVAGQIVLVVRASHTPQHSVLDALHCLEGRPVALVLNQSTSAASSGYYYYGSGATGHAQTGPPG